MRQGGAALYGKLWAMPVPWAMLARSGVEWCMDALACSLRLQGRHSPHPLVRRHAR